MNILTSLTNESVAIGALVSAICVAVDLPEKWMNVALAIIPLLLGMLARAISTSPETVAEVASDAALQAAQQLGTTTVGAMGDTTERGLSVVSQVASDVLDSVGGLTSNLAKRSLHG